MHDEFAGRRLLRFLRMKTPAASRAATPTTDPTAAPAILPVSLGGDAILALDGVVVRGREEEVISGNVAVDLTDAGSANIS